MSRTLQELAELTGAELIGDPNYSVDGIADLQSATPSQVSYLTVHPYGGAIKGYESMMKESKAGAVVVSTDVELPKDKQFLKSDDPSRVFQIIIELFLPPIPSGFEGIHPQAAVHPTAKIGKNVSIGPYAVIDRDAVIGDNTSISPNVSIGPQTVIGDNCLLHPGVVVREGCRLGNRVILQPGVAIGGCGFGYTTDKNGHHQKLRQLGSVILEDDVEIDSNTTIDRARFGTTIVHRGTKIDNLVQIGHGVEVGEDNFIAGQTGIAGSTKTGRHVVLAGQVGVAGHITLADGVIVAARAGVIGSLKKPGKYIGEPARPYEEYKRFFMRLMGLERLYNRTKKLEESLKELQKNSCQ